MPVTDYAVSGEGIWADGTGTVYVGVQGQILAKTNRVHVEQVMSRDGSARYLRIRVVSCSSTDDVTVTLMNGATATGLSKTIPKSTSDSTLEADTTVELVEDDALSWRIELPTSGGSSTTIQWIACEIGEPSE